MVRLALPERGSRFADLGQRTASGLGLGAVALGLLWLGGWVLAALVAAMAAAMAWEWRRMTAAPAGASAVVAAALAATPVLVAQARGFEAGLALLGLGLALQAAMDARAGRTGAALWGLGGGAYLGLAGLSFLALRGFQPFGFDAALWVVIVVVASDVGGYFAGRTLGGPRLWPAVSPKKTWAGLCGGVGLAVLLGGLFSWATTNTYFQEVCVVSGVAALLAQAGDLAESRVKRHFGVKDASRLIPGHGGALDRFDGLLAATLVVTAATAWRGQTVFIW